MYNTHRLNEPHDPEVETMLRKGWASPMTPSSYVCSYDLNLKFSLLAYKESKHLSEASGPLEKKKSIALYL